MSKKKEIPNEAPAEAPVDDASTAMRKRCEPIVQNMLREMLKSEVLFADRTYIRQRALIYLEALMKEVLVDTFNATVDMMELSLARSLDDASVKLWGKDLDLINLKDIDDKLKGQ